MTSSNQLNLYLHPVLSLLKFNQRVLAMAESEETPLLERLKFLCIFSANMDEFFEIRVSGLKARAQSNIASEGVDGISAQQALEEISVLAHSMVERQYALLNDEIVPKLKPQGIEFVNEFEWTDAQRKWLKSYFKKEVLPILTPIRLDPAHPFPITINKGLTIVVDLHDPERDDAHNIAVVPAHRSLPRLVRLPSELSSCEYQYVYLSSIIHAHVRRLFTNAEVLGCYEVRITRNSDLYVDVEEVEDLARKLEGDLPSRLYGEAIRLEVAHKCPKRIIRFLQDRFQLTDEYVYRVDGPVNLNRLMGLSENLNRPHIKYANFSPSVPEFLGQQADYFDAIRNGDILLHHPFQSFTPVVELLRQAAVDPDVLVIKQTLYRIGADSVIIEHLTQAASLGKEVTVIIELMARFDEANNLHAAQRLQEAGAHVVYGIVGKKTHAKMMLIVRKEAKGLKRYVHLGTGNYHQGNTRVYTDYALLSSNSALTQDVHEMFMQLTAQGPNPALQRLAQSPFGISELLQGRIKQQIEYARQGGDAQIIFKVNGLSSPSIINTLYTASQAGVKIELIVRGICCLRPQVPGVSDNIRVRSIVGRFLEHARVYYFAGDDEEREPHVYLASADLMPRNLRHRIEQCAPILDQNLRTQIIEDLFTYLNDDFDHWYMQADGEYTLRTKKSEVQGIRHAQDAMLDRYSESN